MKILDFCQDQEGHKGRGVGLMQCILMHLQSVSFSDVRSFLILESNSFCICKNSYFAFFYFGILMDVGMLPNYSLEESFFLS